MFKYILKLVKDDCVMEVNIYYIIGFIGFRGGYLFLYKIYKFWIVDKLFVLFYIVICG